ncbi:uncharacterized protein LOC127263247 [Andrographis paniculata]|uniref:uncharacterized protein LOC127263247 n=1 Tax=Andrographis paniculata TaxID=175694 RepID=UPI0021E83223|nr:uncharacterized protein LOC127263247 [Andrographis paniculata]
MVVINDLKALLKSEFEMKDLGTVKKILGMEIWRDRKVERLWVSQGKYIGKVLQAFYVISPNRFEEYLRDLKDAFSPMKKYKLKMNPTKCAFGISVGSFLGFLVHERGIEIDANKAKAILTSRPPQTIKEIQNLLGKVNYLRRFISNAAGNRSGAGVLLEGPDGQRVSLQLQMEAMTHNSAEYEALILGLEALIARKVQSVIIKGDSQLVINQIVKQNEIRAKTYGKKIFYRTFKEGDLV